MFKERSEIIPVMCRPWSKGDLLAFQYILRIPMFLYENYYVGVRLNDAIKTGRIETKDDETLSMLRQNIASFSTGCKGAKIYSRAESEANSGSVVSSLRSLNTAVSTHREINNSAPLNFTQHVQSRPTPSTGSNPAPIPTIHHHSNEQTTTTTTTTTATTFHFSDTKQEQQRELHNLKRGSQYFLPRGTSNTILISIKNTTPKTRQACC